MDAKPDWNEGQLDEARKLFDESKLWGCGLLVNADGEPTKPDLLRQCLTGLPKIHRYMPRETLLSLFPNSCPGCLALSLVGAGEVLSDPEFVASTWKEMLSDDNSVIMPLHLFSLLRADAREAWQNKDTPFPGDGRCDWLAKPMQQLLKRHGALLASPTFPSALATDSTACQNFLTQINYFLCTESNPETLNSTLEQHAAAVLDSDWSSHALPY
jgi:hypothetical protein